LIRFPISSTFLGSRSRAALRHSHAWSPSRTKNPRCGFCPFSYSPPLPRHRSHSKFTFPTLTPPQVFCLPTLSIGNSKPEAFNKGPMPYRTLVCHAKPTESFLACWTSEDYFTPPFPPDVQLHYFTVPYLRAAGPPPPSPTFFGVNFTLLDRSHLLRKTVPSPFPPPYSPTLRMVIKLPYACPPNPAHYSSSVWNPGQFVASF